MCHPFSGKECRWRNDVFGDAALHQSPQFVDCGLVGAGVVEHHHSPVLDVVKPTLAGQKPLKTKLLIFFLAHYSMIVAITIQESNLWLMRS